MKRLPYGFVTPVILLVFGLIVGVGVTFAYFQLKSKPTTPQPQPTTASQPTATPASAAKSTPTTNETANWKTYETSKFSILYPPNWIIDSSFPDQFDVAFKSSDYAEDAAPNVTKGFRVYLYVNRGQGKEPSTLGMVSSEPQTWLGKKATLEKNSWEGAYIRLWTNDNADLSLNMATPPFEKPAFKTFEDNKKDFIAVANSLKLK